MNFLRKLISFKKTNDTTSPVSEVNEYAFVFVLEKYFQEHPNLLYPSLGLKEYELRKNGKQYSIDDHIEALVLSKLSNRQKWNRILSKLDDIREIFFNYDCQKILDHPQEYFIEKLLQIKCGSQVMARDFNNLHQNIQLLKNIENTYGTIDSFLLSQPPEKIVALLTDPKSIFKLNTIGPALAWEYLRNVGIDGAKSDVHLKRIFSADRLHLSDKTVLSDVEFYKIINDMHQKTGKLLLELDNYFWSFCADGQAEICTATPKCYKCVIRDFCKHPKE